MIKIKYGFLVALLVWVSQSVPAFAAQHVFGSNIVTPEGTVYTITLTSANGQAVRRPYTSAGAFLSYSFNTWESLVGASNEDLSLPIGSFIPPQDGKVICSDRGGDNGTCYLITNGQKAGFTSADVFLALGYNFDHVMSGDVSFLSPTSNIYSSSMPHKPGALINKNGTIFLVGNSGLIGIPNWDTLQSWGYSSRDIVPANLEDNNLLAVGILPFRESWKLAALTPVSDSNTQAGSSQNSSTNHILSSPFISGPTSATTGVLSAEFYTFIPNLDYPSGYFVTFTYDWGDGSQKLSGSGGGFRVSGHIWKTPGTYTVTVTAVDSLGKSSSNSAIVTVTDPGLPRVGQLVSKYGSFFYVGNNGLYSISTDVFNSWGWSVANVLPASSAEIALPQIGEVPLKSPACGSALEQINGICGGSAVTSTQTAQYLLVTSSSNSFVAWREIQAFDASGNLLQPLSCATDNQQNICGNVYDGDPSTIWNSGTYQSRIMLDYGSNKSVAQIKLLTSNSPNPATASHVVSVAPDGANSYTTLKTFNTSPMYDNQWLVYP